jgi:hypothetical protein
LKKRGLIRKAFAKYVDEDVVGQILNGSKGLPPLETKQIEFAMVLVDGRDPHECSSIIYKSIDIITKYEGMVASIVGPFILVLFGVPVPQPEARSKRKELVKALSEAIGEKASIVHGHAECLVGTLGGESRLGYTALIPGFKEILGRLANSDYGGVLEI